MKIIESVKSIGNCDIVKAISAVSEIAPGNPQVFFRQRDENDTIHMVTGDNVCTFNDVSNGFDKSKPSNTNRIGSFINDSPVGAFDKSFVLCKIDTSPRIVNI